MIWFMIACLIGNISSPGESSKSQIEALIEATLPHAEELLKKYGEFYPFGAAIGRDGKVMLVAGFDGREYPPSAEIITLLEDGFKMGAKEGNYKATALVYDVRVVPPGKSEKTDAIAIALDTKTESFIAYWPYKKDGNRLSFGTQFAIKGKAKIFGWSTQLTPVEP